MSEDSVKVECPTCGQHYTLPSVTEAVTVACERCSAEFLVEPINEEVPISGGGTAPRPAQEWVPARKAHAPVAPVPRPPLASAAGSWLPGATGPSRGAGNPWAVLYDVRIFLGWLADGSLIRNVTGFSIYVAAVCASLACLGVWTQSMKLFSFANGFIGQFGALLWMVFFPYSCYLAISAAWTRAGDIRRLPPGKFAISPILSVLVNLHGEIIFILCAVWSVPLALLAWGCYASLEAVREMPVSNGFLLGFALFLVMWSVGYGIYLLTRWLQEMIFVFPSMAHHLDLIESHLRRGKKD